MAHTMPVAGNLAAYVSYFEYHSGDFCTWEAEPTGSDDIPAYHPRYEGELLRFIESAGSSGLMRTDYMNALGGFDPSAPMDFIQAADVELLRAVLTYYVRQERFCEGLWAKAAGDGVFLAILHRLGELQKQIEY